MGIGIASCKGFCLQPSSPLSQRLLLAIVRFLAADEIAFLHSGSQTSSANDVQEIELFLPVHATTQEVTVEAKRVTRVCGVLAAESETGRHEV